MKAWLIGAALVVASATGASAQGQCAPKGSVLDTFKETFGEIPVAALPSLGVGATFIILANPDTGSWTMLAEPLRQPGVLCTTGLSGEDYGKPMEQSDAPAVPENQRYKTLWGYDVLRSI